MKDHRRWPCAKSGAAEHQITDLLCAGVYEVDHYHGSMIYIRATSPHHVRRSKPLVVLSLLHEH